MIIQKTDNYPSSLNSIQFDEYNFEDIHNSHNKTIQFNLLKDNIRYNNISFGDANYSYNREDGLFQDIEMMNNKSSFIITDKIGITFADLNERISNFKHQFSNVKNYNEKIFKITKDFKGKGRIKKNTNYVGKHTKFSEDNIIRKIKRIFLDSCWNYINLLHKKYLLKTNAMINKKKLLLQKIESKVSQQIKKEKNIKWFESQLYEVLSENVSDKCCNYSKDYNKRQIKVLFEINKATEVIEFLHKPIKSIYEDYIKDKDIDGFKTLKDDLKILREKMIEDGEENVDDYLKKYKSIAHNLFSIFKIKNSRNNCGQLKHLKKNSKNSRKK